MRALRLTVVAFIWVVLMFSIGLLLASYVRAYDGCYPVPVTDNTPTGVAGCEVFGDGTASHYGPGSGVAMNFCTWVLRHSTGCGWVSIRSHQTGIVVTVPVVDFGDLYTGTAQQRIADLQWGVVDALGLDRSQGLYEVTVWREQVGPLATPASASGPSLMLPDTAGSGPGAGRGMATAGSAFLIALFVLIASHGLYSLARHRWD